MLNAARIRRRAHAEGGFTLVEVLVTIVTGIVVLGAAYTILEVSLHQSSRLADYGQATQLGRTAMTRVVDELHSACLSPSFKPVQEQSNDHELSFINAYSEEAEIKPESARKDRIVWNEASKTLTDYTYPANGGTWPNFTFASAASPAKGVRLADGVTKSENSKKEKEPIFRYYAYAVTPPANGETEMASSTLNESEPLTPPANGFGALEAEKVASVRVRFTAAPTSGSKEAARSVDLASQVTFAFSAPNSESTITAGPCE